MLFKVFFFSLAIMAEKQMFKALVMVELLDSGGEEGTKGGRMTRGWLKEIGELQSGRGIWSGMGGPV